MRYKNNNNSKKKSYKNYTNVNESKSNFWLLMPVIFVISVLPFITRLKQTNANLSIYPWFPLNDIDADFFLYYKKVLFLFAVCYMFILVLYKIYINNISMEYTRILIPLTIYGTLTLLSSLFSKFRTYSLRGTIDHHEPVFVFLGYCIIVYYVLLYIQTEKDIEIIINCFIISIILMSILGLTQYLGKDFFATTLGKKLILPKSYWNNLDLISFNFEKNRVYLTLHNPNYVGSYIALAAPLILILTFFIKNKYWKLPIYLTSFAGILICLIGSKSKTAIIGLIAGGLLAVIVFYRFIIKYFYLSIPFIFFVIGLLFTYNNANNNLLVNQLKQAFNFVKTEPALEDIQTLDDKILITYQGNKLQIISFPYNNDVIFLALDENNNSLPLLYNEEKNCYIIMDDRFPGFELGYALFNDINSFYVNIDEHDWFFTNFTPDNTYYYITRYGKLDKIIKAPSVLFNGYEKYASGRGYIWSRTIPLLKKYLFLGAGADTYVLAFPQQDYVNLYNYGFSNQILTKPHNMYLQIAVQSGVLSLVAYLVFYAMYFVSSFKLYIKSKFISYYSQVGVAILISTFTYMVVSLANDSIIAVSPIFWVLIGLGIVTNKKEKKLLGNA
ncbi:O-antigen ligase-like membrane protein [Herbinix hemicellulosilytica]|uniref:Putative membrane protein n=1 Tax=Herbinix hemicellulosilytica TaxID=1564487 RepID=A0A0H5SE95_HERHM|nr:O-antigen ligase family protein [Herbinix hemicellulosilytica]RBP56942.1 O-antigen ligase-like membrane protein [Herbinix hemicellulosilytica]CRZ33370.1 putative membrane protein [Herbinix hemicellulosilytica]